MDEIINELLLYDTIKRFKITKLLIQSEVDYKSKLNNCYYPVPSLKITTPDIIIGQINDVVIILKRILSRSNYTYCFYDITENNVTIMIYNLNKIDEKNVKRVLISEFISNQHIRLDYNIDKYNNLIVEKRNNKIMQSLHNFIIDKNLDYEVVWYNLYSICIQFILPSKIK